MKAKELHEFLKWLKKEHDLQIMDEDPYGNMCYCDTPCCSSGSAYNPVWLTEDTLNKWVKGFNERKDNATG